MGNKILSRKDFLKNIVASKNNAVENPVNDDPLFEKYSRKNLANRHFSQQTEIPSIDGSAARIGNVISGLTQYNGVWTDWEAIYLLRRISYGAKKVDVDNLLSLDMSASVDLMCNFTAPANPTPTPINHYQSYEPETSGVALGASWTQSFLTYGSHPNDNYIDYLRERSLKDWLWGISINDATSLREKMVQFWYHFIPINAEANRNMEGNSSIMANDYLNIFRTGGLGNFKTLIKKVSKSPAMLVYLGGQYSTASVPNENFARELFELFTLGKVPTQNYTEDDVKAASKIFSGWVSSDFYGGTAYPFTTSFNPTKHNQTNKTFSNFFGNTTIANQAGAAGANEFDLFFDMLFNTQGITVAKYVCRRLYRFFVYYDIDNNVEFNVITPLANLLISSNWEIMPVVKKLLKSEHFYDVVNRGVTIKSPIDFLLGLVRTLKINTTVPNSATQPKLQYEVWDVLQYRGALLEQGYLEVPNVSGWKAYYQHPTYYQNWISSNTIQQRAQFLEGLIGGWINSYPSNFNVKIDVLAFVQQFPNTTIENPDLLVNTIVKYLLAVDLPVPFKNTTKVQTLLSNQTADYYWTVAWNDYILSPTNAGYKTIVTERLSSLINTILQLSEFQLI